MAVELSTVSKREKLKGRHAPYWVNVRKGCYLGIRKTTTASDGSWVARWRSLDTGKQVLRSLGKFENLPNNERYDAAKKEAEAWFTHLGQGGTAEVVTVKAACENYVKRVRDTKGDTQADDVEARFDRWVFPEKIAAVELSKLTRRQVEAWRKKLADTPVVANPHAPEELQRTHKRSPSSVNRDITPLRAALNYAKEQGDATSDLAWLAALKPTAKADGRRDVYLPIDQRRKLIESAEPALGKFMRGLSVVPLRPGALAALTVASFDARRGVLTVGKDKAGGDRRLKLPASTAAFFAAQCKDKLPAAPLFTRSDGRPWDKDTWKVLVKEAALAAELTQDTVIYSLRHSAITDLVTNGLDLLTVAQLSGTGVSMIEKHYGHLRADHAAQALERLAL